ncbi:hypothetical protein L1887_20209 [Cichorium endivia]|nr:hypothetical protein L1887_20209 [Cichorium endivia]
MEITCISNNMTYQIGVRSFLGSKSGDDKQLAEDHNLETTVAKIHKDAKSSRQENAKQIVEVLREIGELTKAVVALSKLNKDYGLMFGYLGYFGGGDFDEDKTKKRRKTNKGKQSGKLSADHTKVKISIFEGEHAQ